MGEPGRRRSNSQERPKGNPFTSNKKHWQGWKSEQKHVWMSQKGKKISKALPAPGNRKEHVGHGFYITQKPLQGFAGTLQTFRTSWWNKHGLNSLQGCIFRCTNELTSSLPNSLPFPPQQPRGMGASATNISQPGQPFFRAF